MRLALIILKWFLGVLVLPFILLTVFIVWFMLLIITLLLGIQQMVEGWLYN